MFTTQRKCEGTIDCSYNSIGDPYKDPSKSQEVAPRFKGKQFITNPPKAKAGDVGNFDKYTYQTSEYRDKLKYLSSQPADKRLLGFGSKDASKRDEFTTTIRTEQYRTQLESEKPQNRGGDSLDEMVETIASPPQKRTFLFDIGRSQETEFDPKTKKDTYYKIVGRKQERIMGPHTVASLSVGSGTKGLDHSTCKPQHGHIKATKQFFDKGHL